MIKLRCCFFLFQHNKGELHILILTNCLTFFQVPNHVGLISSQFPGLHPHQKLILRHGRVAPNHVFFVKINNRNVIYQEFNGHSFIIKPQKDQTMRAKQNKYQQESMMLTHIGLTYTQLFTVTTLVSNSLELLTISNNRFIKLWSET